MSFCLLTPSLCNHTLQPLGKTNFDSKVLNDSLITIFVGSYVVYPSESRDPITIKGSLFLVNYSSLKGSGKKEQEQSLTMSLVMLLLSDLELKGSIVFFLIDISSCSKQIHLIEEMGVFHRVHSQ